MQILQCDVSHVILVLRLSVQHHGEANSTTSTPSVVRVVNIEHISSNLLCYPTGWGVVSSPDARSYE